jgi:hypothetical protein
MKAFGFCCLLLIPALLAFAADPRALSVQIASAVASGCTKHTPCPVIAFNPPMPTELDSTAPGTVIAHVVVTLNPSNAGPFTGTWKFGGTGTFGNDNGLLAKSGNDIVLVNSFQRGSSIQNATIVATQ